jgi:hypothetical protein
VTGYHGPRILVALAERPYSGRELAGLLDCSESEVRRCVGNLRDDGYPIVGGVPGSHDGALYMLRTADYFPARTCRWTGCRNRLSPMNDSDYCRGHREDAALDALIADLERDVEGDGAAPLPVSVFGWTMYP